MFDLKLLLLGAGACALLGLTLAYATALDQAPKVDDLVRATPLAAKAGRPVRIVSLSFQGQPREEILRVIDREAGKGVDLVALPETWLGQGEGLEPLEGETIAAVAALARKHKTYIVCPMDRKLGDRRLNTAVLIDRSGEVVGMYNKCYPYWSEFDLKPPVVVGRQAPVFETDFGRLGLAICFDVNLPEVCPTLADEGPVRSTVPTA